jgi:hypothetical protein
MRPRTGEQLLSKAEVLSRSPGISARQLKRWQRSHLIDAPVQTHRPGLRGSVSLYPARVLKQIAALREASGGGSRSNPQRVRVSYRRSGKMFTLFWDGHDTLVPDPHEVIASVVAPIIKFRDSFGAQESIEEDESVADEIAGDLIEEGEYGGDRALQLVEEHIKGHEDEVRKKIALGRMSTAEVTSFSYAAAGLFFGSLTAGESLEGQDGGLTYADLLFRGYGLAGSREHPSPLPSARDATERASFLNDMRDRIEPGLSESFLRSLSVEDLRQVRTDLREFIEGFESFGTLLSRLVGRKALGLAEQAKWLASASIEGRAILLLFFAHARETMPENYKVLLSSMERNVKTFRDALRALKNLPPQKQKSLKAAMRVAARSGFSEVHSPAALAFSGNETENGST